MFRIARGMRLLRLRRLRRWRDAVLSAASVAEAGRRLGGLLDVRYVIETDIGCTVGLADGSKIRSYTPYRVESYHLAAIAVYRQVRRRGNARR